MPNDLPNTALTMSEILLWLYFIVSFKKYLEANQIIHDTIGQGSQTGISQMRPAATKMKISKNWTRFWGFMRSARPLLKIKMWPLNTFGFETPALGGQVSHVTQCYDLTSIQRSTTLLDSYFCQLPMSRIYTLFVAIICFFNLNLLNSFLYIGLLLNYLCVKKFYFLLITVWSTSIWFMRVL